MIFLFLVSAFAQFPEENHVIVLDKSTFSEALDNYQKILVEFYAPWCEHCKEFAPEYSKAAESLKKNKIPLAKVDGSENRELVDKYNIKGYPSLIYFVEGNPTDYTGVRTAAGVIDWVTERQKKKIFKVSESGGISSLLEKPGPFALFLGKISDTERSVFEFAAINVKDFEFFESDSEEDAFKVSVKSPKILVFQKGEKFEYNGNINTLDLIKYMEKFKPAKVHKFNDQTAKMIFDYQSTTFFYLGDKEAVEGKKEILKQLAAEFKETFVFTFCDLAWKGNGVKLADALGIKAESQPLVVIVDFQDAFNKYKSSDLTEEGIRKFIAMYADKSLSPYFKSQEVPLPDTENGVKVIVGKNHQEIVLDNSKVVVVLYYAPEHPKCAEFLPKYERLAKETRKWPDLTIGKFDLSKNEVEGLKVKMVPLLKIFPKDQKSGIVYSGEMIKSDIKDALRKYVELSPDL
jgi:protein disulfide-isomerase A1